MYQSCQLLAPPLQVQLQGRRHGQLSTAYACLPVSMSRQLQRTDDAQPAPDVADASTRPTRSSMSREMARRMASGALQPHAEPQLEHQRRGRLVHVLHVRKPASSSRRALAQAVSDSQRNP